MVHRPRADGGVYLGPFAGVAPARFVRSALEAAVPLRRGGEVGALVRRGLTGEGELVLAPLADRVEALARAGRAGDAANALQQLRALSGALRRQATVDGLRASGRMTVDVAGHEVVLDGGRLMAVDGAPIAWSAAAGGPGGRRAAGRPAASESWGRSRPPRPPSWPRCWRARSTNPPDHQPPAGPRSG